MANSYLKVRDSAHTAWFKSERICNIADAAALLSKTIDTASEPDIAAMERRGGSDLRPITQGEYTDAVRGLTFGHGYGLVAEIDLAGDRGSFTYLASCQDAYIVSGAVSRIAGIYKMSVDRATGKLDEWALTNGLVQHCSWEHVTSPAERFGAQEQEPAASQGMTMQ